MDASLLVAVLSIFTLGIVVAFAIMSKRKVEERMDDPDAPKSTLAADAPNER